MRTFLTDLIPKIQRYSQKLDNNTLLSDKHWVVIDELGKNNVIYIFRTNNDLLISQNGKVEKAKWEYIGNDSLLIDKREESYLFRQGFVDENILVLKVDGKDEYAILINEKKYGEALNSVEKILDFLTREYVKPQNKREATYITSVEFEDENDVKLVNITTNKGVITVDIPPKDRGYNTYYFAVGQKVYLNGKQAPDGKYHISIIENIIVKDGVIDKVTVL